MKGNSEEARSLNGFLDITKSSVYDYQKDLMQHYQLVNVENMRRKLLGEKEKIYTIIPIFQEHNQKMEALLDVEFAPGTLERYKTSLSHTIAFLKWKYNIVDIDIKKIDNAFII